MADLSVSPDLIIIHSLDWQGAVEVGTPGFCNRYLSIPFTTQQEESCHDYH